MNNEPNPSAQMPIGSPRRLAGVARGLPELFKSRQLLYKVRAGCPGVNDTRFRRQARTRPGAHLTRRHSMLSSASRFQVTCTNYNNIKITIGEEPK